jgi:sulfhydrogenase subunit beta (sulfur reductase)
MRSIGSARLDRGTRVVIERRDLDALVDVLRELGHQVIGPMVSDGAVVYGEVKALAELPLGWGDEQDAGAYRLVERNDAMVFGYNLGPDAWKKFLFPPRLKLFEARRREQSFDIIASDTEVPHYALLGVRACELQAIAVQDRVFSSGAHTDAHYYARRQQAFVVAVNCTQAAATCFCAAMDAGPAVPSWGHDLALTELLQGGEHLFVVEVGSEQGAAVLMQLRWREATAVELAAAAQVPARTRESMTRHMDTQGLKELLYQNPEHPHWQVVADRCLTCANCTLVCPTCFCSAVEEHSAIDGQTTARWRRWDSCFNTEFSHTGGGSVRGSPYAKYRQWLTHKLASWIDQFGSSGCVGCGRCIAWCPVGIDITAEVRALRQPAMPPSHGKGAA